MPGPVFRGQFVALLVNQPVDEAAHLIRHFPLRLLFDRLILGPGFFHPLFDGRLIHVQNPAEAARDILLVQNLRRRVGFMFLFRAGRRLFRRLPLLFDKRLNFQRGDVHRLRRRGDGQRKAIAVINGTSGCRHHGAARLLAGSPLLKLLMPLNLQIEQFPEQHPERHHAQQQHNPHGPGTDDLIGPPRAVNFPAAVLAGICLSFPVWAEQTRKIRFLHQKVPPFKDRPFQASSDSQGS